MAVFFTGSFTRELRRETERRFRRDTIDHVFRRMPGVSPFSARNTFAGLNTRRAFSGRSSLQALRKPVSQQTGSSSSQYSSSGNQSRSSVGRGRNAQKTKTEGTSGTSGTSRRSSTTSGTGRTTGTRPTNFSRSGSTGTRRTRSSTSTPNWSNTQ